MPEQTPRENLVFKRLVDELDLSGRLDVLIVELKLEEGHLPGREASKPEIARAILKQLKLRVPPELERLAGMFPPGWDQSTVSGIAMKLDYSELPERSRGEPKSPNFSAAAPGGPLPASPDEMTLTMKRDLVDPQARMSIPFLELLVRYVQQRPDPPLWAQPPPEYISWQEVQAQLADDLDPRRKRPAMQELRTEQQIRDHFLLLTENERRLDEWLKDRDLLFLGLPFCGKTTFLTFLSLRAASVDRALLPIALHPRVDLAVEEADVGVARLKQSFEQSRVLGQRRTPVLILDNVHRPEVFAVARLLMTSPRRWRVWAAARSAEFAERLASGVACPWDNRSQIKDACDLVGKDEADEMVDRVLAPLLIEHGEPNRIEEVRDALKAAGQVPMRFFIRVWKLIYERKRDVDSGYLPFIQKEPREVEDVIRSLWPQSRAGVDALAIALFLEGPSWDLLAYVLAHVEDYGIDLAESTIRTMRTTLALLNDPVQPTRVSMYDPIRERVKEPGNLTQRLREQIWSGVEAFLCSAQDESSFSDDLYASWLQIAQVAGQQEKLGLRIECARRSFKYAPDNVRHQALYFLAYCLHNKPDPDWAGAIDGYRQAEALGRDAPPDQRASTYSWLAYCLHNKPDPDWAGAIDGYRQAEALGRDAPPDQRASTYYWLAYCLHNKPDPDWAGSIAAYRQAEALGRDAPPDQRASTYYWLAYCLHNKPDPDWAGAIDAYRQAEALERDAPPDQRAPTYSQLAYCLRSKPDPDWAGAIAAYRSALALDQRAPTYYWLAYCLHNKPDPDWAGAIAAYRQAEALERDAPPDQRAPTYYQLAYCLRSKPDPDWAGAIDAYRSALALNQRARTYSQLAYCLRSKPDPDWDGAIAAYRSALALDQRAPTYYWLAYCLHHKSDPDWAGAIDAYRQAEALEWDAPPDQRALTYYQLAYCLHNKPDPDWAGAIDAYRSALALDQRALTYYQLAYCLRSKPDPDWAGAIDAYRSALALDQRALTYYQLAYCLHNKPDPDWAGAIDAYRSALALDQRALTYYQLAYCLRSKPDPDWAGAIAAYRSALALDQRAPTYYLLAYCLHNKPDPDWAGAIDAYRQAEALERDAPPDQRARTYSQLAYCLRSKPDPDWNGAIAAYRSALALDQRAPTYYELAYCLHNKPDPDWDGAIDAYRQAEALERDAPPDQRAPTYYQLAYCLHNKPDPDWAGAIAAYRSALALDQRALTYYQLAYCLRQQA